MKLSIRIEGLDEAVRHFRTMPAHVRRELPKASTNVAERLKQNWRAGVSGQGDRNTLGLRTGHFRSRIRRRKVGYAAQMVGTDHPAAMIHERGGTTRPHDIFPVRAQALRFIGAGGQVVFAKVVHHPGSVMPPRPHMRPAVEKTKRDAPREFQLALRRGLKAAGFHEGTQSGPTPFTRIGTGVHEAFRHSPEVEAAAGALADLLRRGS